MTDVFENEPRQRASAFSQCLGHLPDHFLHVLLSFLFSLLATLTPPQNSFLKASPSWGTSSLFPSGQATFRGWGEGVDTGKTIRLRVCVVSQTLARQSPRCTRDTQKSKGFTKAPKGHPSNRHRGATHKILIEF